MPVPTLITDLSTTAASNSPAGTDSVLPNLDDYLRAHASFIAQLNAYDARLLAGLGLRNRVINGDFRVNQREYVSGTATTSANQYTLDRWRVVTSGQSVTWTTSKNGKLVTAPAGGIEQVIEGESIEGGVYTLSFTGTATARVNGSIVANGGQTASLTGGSDVTLKFSGGTVGEVQFEAGDLETPFEQRPIGLELSLCQRYYERGGFNGTVNADLATRVTVIGGEYKVQKRGIATVTWYGYAMNSGFVTKYNASTEHISISGVVSSTRGDENGTPMYITLASAPGVPVMGFWTADAEF